MKIYLFKSANNEIVTMNETSAHNEMTNRGQWQRQDLKYIGACEDTTTKTLKELNDESLQEVIKTHPKVSKIYKEIRLAELNEEALQVEKKKIELDILTTDMQVSFKEFFSPSPEIDELKALYLKAQQENLNKAYEMLVPDPNILPRNFNTLSSNFGGGDSSAFPTDILKL